MLRSSVLLIEVIGVPNTNSLYGKFFKTYWYGRDIPRHIYNYNAHNLSILLDSMGFNIINIHYLSTGGILGSLQHFFNFHLKKNYSLIHNLFLVFLLFPIDMLCNFIKQGDSISIIAKCK